MPARVAALVEERRKLERILVADVVSRGEMAVQGFDRETVERTADCFLELADKLPRHGDVFEKDGYKFSGQTMYGRRLRSIRVTAPEAVAVDTDHEETDEE